MNNDILQQHCCHRQIHLLLRNYILHHLIVHLVVAKLVATKLIVKLAANFIATKLVAKLATNWVANWVATNFIVGHILIVPVIIFHFILLSFKDCLP